MPTAPTADRATVTLARARALKAALERLAEAMAARDSAAVLACEPELAAALSADSLDLPGGDRPGVDQSDAAAHDLASARNALARCRALGAAHALVTDITLDAMGCARPYGRQGAGTAEHAFGRDLHRRA